MKFFLATAFILCGVLHLSAAIDDSVVPSRFQAAWAATKNFYENNVKPSEETVASAKAKLNQVSDHLSNVADYVAEDLNSAKAKVAEMVADSEWAQTASKVAQNIKSSAEEKFNSAKAKLTEMGADLTEQANNKAQDLKIRAAATIVQSGIDALETDPHDQMYELYQ